MSVAIAVLSSLLAASPATDPTLSSEAVTRAATPATEAVGVGILAEESQAPQASSYSAVDDSSPAQGGTPRDDEDAGPQRFDAVTDPARTQLMLSPSAHTLGEDDSRVSATQLLFYQYNYGLTDDLQLGLNSFFIFATSIDLKWRFLHTEDFSAAALVGMGLTPVQRGTYGAYTRLVGTWHRDRFEASLGWSYLLGWSKSDSLHVGSAMGGLSWQVGRHTRLIAEYNLAMELATHLFDDAVYSVVWGPRFFWESLAITPGYITPLHRETLRNYLIGIPYLDISYSF